MTRPGSTTTAHPGAHTARGRSGAAATAHHLATDAALELLRAGGTAVDAAIAAQAVICVVMPQAAGLGGDLLALVHDAGSVHAVNGTGRAPRGLTGTPPATGGASVTVPGLVGGWSTLHRRWGRSTWASVLRPALRLAAEGAPLDSSLVKAARAQRPRLEEGGASRWALLAALDRPGAETWVQPDLARLIDQVAARGADAFYDGAAAEAMITAVRRHGGTLDRFDLLDHTTPCPEPVAVSWQRGQVHVSPPMSQGVLLAMALQRVAELERAGVGADDHVLVEVIGAAFGHRSAVGRGRALLAEQLKVDLQRASRRGGPRGYLHTAGVATVDGAGQVVSSLISVFDDFGSGVLVPDLGVVLNNRAAGFTDGDNAPAAGARPVHTLAPALLTSPEGVLALATPGADGQVQTLLQVLTGLAAGRSVAEAVSMPRWRSQSGDLLVEDAHPALDALVGRGHHVVPVEPGAEEFGAVVAAGWTGASSWACSDWRRGTTSRGTA